MTPLVAIAGVGMHPFGRFPEASLKDLARVAVLRAVADAGIELGDVDAVYSANAMAGLLQNQEQIRGQSVLREVGIERVPVVNVENACAGGSTALREAVLAVRAGAYRTVLVLGFEKMFVGDRDRSLAALETAADTEIVAGLGLQFTAVYAMRLRKRLDSGSLQLRHLVDAAVKSRGNGARNPYAQYRTPCTADEVLSSRMIADPLTLLMCSSISDGAAAVIVCRASVEAGGGARPRVLVRGSAAASGFTPVGDDEPSTATVCADAAYAEAGVGPMDVGVVEVHDAMAPGELLYYEQLGFCPAGGAGDMLDSGATRIAGRLPVNPSGGLCSRGHPVGATGLAQIAELTWQLRGEAGERQVSQPRFALAHNSGGWLEGEPAACNVHILERERAW
jgi:acetyl-CoA acetyltransferase